MPLKTALSAWRSKIWLLAVVAAIGLLWLQRQTMYDQIRLHGYKPPVDIARLATDTTMTDSARRVYYVNHPVLQEKSVFTASCSFEAEKTVVLGCYKSGQRGIYLLRVNNDDLKGIQQVTAAHEMLHAVYDRLSPSERSHINALLRNYYQAHSDDAAVKQIVTDYEHSDATDLINEMHSIFGTQIASLPAELTTHYTKYFTNRSQVVKYYQSYEVAFSSRRDQIKQYDAQLNTWKEEIDRLMTLLSNEEAALNSQQKTMDAHRQSGDTAAYNQLVDDYNTAVREYNNDIKKLQNLTKDYNELVNQRNSIAFEERKLVEALSAKPL